MEVLVLFLRPKKVVPIQRASGQTLKGHEFALLSGIKYHSLYSALSHLKSPCPLIWGKEEGRGLWGRGRNDWVVAGAG